jgi:arginyl-tRNA synthetase
MFEIEQKDIETKINTYFDTQGIPVSSLNWNWIPFSGHWGISTSFFQTAAQESRQGRKVNVPQRAQEIAQMVANHLGKPVGFEHLEAVKGYLNLYFSTPEYTQRVIDTVLEQGNRFGHGDATNQKVMVEFSQPNTHKAFHVGHLRTMFLGDCVSNILEFAGNNVIRANYIGDIGLHVIKWLWNYLNYHKGELPGNDVTRWMGDLYEEANERYFSSKEIEAEVRSLFGQWEKRDPELVTLWQKSRQWSLDGFEQVYHLLGVHFDHFYFESEVEEPGKEMVAQLIKLGLARDERPEGAVIIPLDEIVGTKEKYRTLVILRSDGSSLYSTKDLALTIKKFTEYQLDRSIYVVDVRQSLYFQQIFKTLELMGYSWPKSCYHLAYEIVNLPGNVVMSSREGTVVLLEDWVREAIGRALDIVKTKNPDLPPEKQRAVAKAVALGAIRYSLLARESTKVVTFDWQAALDFDGQAAPYIQYAAVRANSIIRKSGGEIPESLQSVNNLVPAEIHMVDLISRFPNEVQRAANELRPLYIASLAYDLAKAFNDFYSQCPVLQVDEQTRKHRLRLVAAARQAISNCLALLGIETPEVM